MLDQIIDAWLTPRGREELFIRWNWFKTWIWFVPAMVLLSFDLGYLCYSLATI